MFSVEDERVIPRKQVNLAALIIQIFFGIFFLFILGMTFFGGQIPDRFGEFIPFIMPIFVVFLLLIPLGFGIFGRWVQHRKWKALADQLGFQAEQPNVFTLPTLTGTYRGHRFVISQSSQQRGRSRIYFTNYLVMLNTPSRNSFEIKKRSILHLNRNRIGDEEFDKKFSTQTSSERLVNKILSTRRLRLGIFQLGHRARTRNLTLSGETLAYTERGQTLDTEYMHSVISFLGELATAIEHTNESDYFQAPRPIPNTAPSGEASP